MLTTRAPDALDRLLRIRLPAGVAAGEYDADGDQVGEPHHAALAGFVAWTLVRAAEPGTGEVSKRKKRR
jgi:hypothetical protein